MGSQSSLTETSSILPMRVRRLLACPMTACSRAAAGGSEGTKGFAALDLGNDALTPMRSPVLLWRKSSQALRRRLVPLLSLGGSLFRLLDMQRIGRRAGELQQQLHVAAETREQCGRQFCIAIGPAEAIVRLITVPTVDQPIIVRLDQRQLGTSAQLDAPERHTQGAGIARHAHLRGNSLA
jgi:hypothetical protein